MGKEALVYHLHQWSITTETYNKVESMKKMFKVIATDSQNGVEFVNAFEAYNYPIYGMIFHPEYQNMEFLSDIKMNNLDNADTFEIVLSFSKFMNNEARKSLHRYPDNHLVYRSLLDRVPLSNYPLGVKTFIRAHGVN